MQTGQARQIASPSTTSLPRTGGLLNLIRPNWQLSGGEEGRAPSLPGYKPSHHSQELSLQQQLPSHPPTPQLLKAASSIHQLYRSRLLLVWYLPVFEAKWEGWQSWHDISAFSDSFVPQGRYKVSRCLGFFEEVLLCRSQWRSPPWRNHWQYVFPAWSSKWWSVFHCYCYCLHCV